MKIKRAKEKLFKYYKSTKTLLNYLSKITSIEDKKHFNYIFDNIKVALLGLSGFLKELEKGINPYKERDGELADLVKHIRMVRKQAERIRR